jgi:hypothetical protein
MHNIASLMAILVMRFYIAPVGGLWKDPRQDGTDTAAQVSGPVDRTRARMTPREDLSKVS